MLRHLRLEVLAEASLPHLPREVAVRRTCPKSSASTATKAQAARTVRRQRSAPRAPGLHRPGAVHRMRHVRARVPCRGDLRRARRTRGRAGLRRAQRALLRTLTRARQRGRPAPRLHPRRGGARRREVRRVGRVPPRAFADQRSVRVRDQLGPRPRTALPESVAQRPTADVSCAFRWLQRAVRDR